MSITVCIVDSQKVICRTVADEVILPGIDGLIGILDGHVSIMTMLDIAGLLRLKVNGKWTPIVLQKGVAAIYYNSITLMAEKVEEFPEFPNSKKFNEITKELENAIINFQQVKTKKDRIEAYGEMKKAKARVEALKYLSKKE